MVLSHNRTIGLLVNRERQQVLPTETSVFGWPLGATFDG
jgi:hypothetical protein